MGSKIIILNAERKKHYHYTNRLDMVCFMKSLILNFILVIYVFLQYYTFGGPYIFVYEEKVTFYELYLSLVFGQGWLHYI